MRFAEVGDIITIKRKKWRVKKVNDLGQDCWSYSLESIKGFNYKWLGIGRRITISSSSISESKKGGSP
jgi:hypothetical protein